MEKIKEHQKANAALDEAFFEASQKGFNVYLQNLPTAIMQTTSFAGAVAMVSEQAAKFQGNLAGVTQKVGLFTQIFGSRRRSSATRTRCRPTGARPPAPSADCSTRKTANRKANERINTHGN
jgi:hypothetical protein